MDKHAFKKSLESQIDDIFRRIDRRDLKRTRNIRLIPGREDRIGGKRAYGEWCHVAGIFQTLMYQLLENKTGNRILDVGCGNGLLGIPAEPFVGGNGEYMGIDVNQEYINFCKSHYDFPNYTFIHHNVKNPVYADGQPDQREKWPVESGSLDLVTALSVWTHLREEDALFYMKEVARVLKPGKKAMITFFYLNPEYYHSLDKRNDAPGQYHMTNQDQWVFDKNAYGSQHWFCVYDVPEKAMGVDEQGMKMLAKEANLDISTVYNGNWKEIPGIFFQDVIVFQKK